MNIVEIQPYKKLIQINSIEQKVISFAIENPAYGLAQVFNELKK